MKYPILKLKFTPQLHKAFSKPIILHFDMTENELHEQQSAYAHHLIKQASDALAGQFLSNQAVLVQQKQKLFILCKDSLDIRLMKRHASALLCQMKDQLPSAGFVFGYAKGMLLVEGRSIGILNSSKVGDDFLESAEYRASVNETVMDSSHLSGCILPTFEEFIRETAETAIK